MEANLKKARLSRISSLLKILKRGLPSSCTHLSLLKNSKGEYEIRGIVKNQEYRYTIDQTLKFSNGEFERVKGLIVEKC